VAAGALLFQEEGNLEIGNCFEEGKEFVSYNEENLEERLEYYLDHEEERVRIAEAGKVKVREFTFENLWAKQLQLIAGEWEEIVERCDRRITNHKEYKGHKEGNISRGDAEAAENTDSSCPLCPSWLNEIEELVRQGRHEEAIAALNQLDSPHVLLSTYYYLLFHSMFFVLSGSARRGAMQATLPARTRQRRPLCAGACSTCWDN
jgi:hypothetical protein